MKLLKWMLEFVLPCCSDLKYPLCSFLCKWIISVVSSLLGTISVIGLLSILSTESVTPNTLSELLYQCEWDFNKSLNVLFSKSEVTSDCLSHRTLIMSFLQLSLSLAHLSSSCWRKKQDVIMADNSTLVSETGRSLLADSSVLDSKIIETSKENVLPGSALDVEGNGRSLL